MPQRFQPRRLAVGENSPGDDVRDPRRHARDDPDIDLRVQGLGFRVWGLGLGFRV